MGNRKEVKHKTKKTVKIKRNLLVMSASRCLRDVGNGKWEMGCGKWDMGFGIWDMGYVI